MKADQEDIDYKKIEKSIMSWADKYKVRAQYFPGDPREEYPLDNLLRRIKLCITHDFKKVKEINETL